MSNMAVCLIMSMYTCILYLTASVGEDPLLAACEKTGRFPCRSDGRCLTNSSVCNGIIDCSDGSDELDCEGLKPCILQYHFITVTVV